MKMPYDGDFRVASEYGARIDPINGESAFHGGIDLVSLGSRAIKCVEDGIVLRSRIVTDNTNRTSEWGNYVSVQSGERTYYYCHMSERLVSAGDQVRAGDVLGIEGSTGRSTGSHLHLEVRIGDKTLDPTNILGLPNTAGYIFRKPEKTEEPHDWAKDAVRWAEDSEIMQGDGRGSFRLGDNITREECAVMLYRMFALINKGKEV